MKKFLLPFVALSIILTSCSRDNDDVINNPISNPVAQGDLLVEITHPDEPSFIPRFTYNGDKLQGFTGGDGNMSFTYDGDQITNIYRDKGPLLGNWFTRYAYNPDGTLLYSAGVHKGERRHPNSTADSLILINYKVETVREYTYTGNIVKVKETIKSSDDLSSDVRTMVQEHSFTLDNGNIIKKVIETNYGYKSNITTTFTYDNKINPLGKIKGLAALNIEFSLGNDEGPGTFIYMNGNKNNILSEKIEGQTGSTFEYEYNSKGYPTKQTEKYPVANNEIHTAVSHYTYK